MAAARGGTSVLAAAGAAAGLLNYAFVLIVAALLVPRDFVVVAAGQGLLLVVGSAASATVPWLTAQRLALLEVGAAGRTSIARASVLTALLVGGVAGSAVVAAAPFADPVERVALGAAAFLVCLGQVAPGWAQGSGRFRLLAGLVVGEVVIKVGFGTGAAASGTGALGVFTAAAAGGALLSFAGAWLVWSEATTRGRGGGGALHGWWRAAATIGTARTSVAALGVVDVVLVAAIVDTHRATAAYQLAMSLGRVPLFLATAVGQAWLGVLTRHPDAGGPITETWRRLLTLAVPAAAAVATLPAGLAERVLPTGSDVQDFLPAAAFAGLALGTTSLASTWGQARATDHRWVAVLVGLVVGHVSAILLASRTDDLIVIAWTTAVSMGVVTAVITVLTTRPIRWRSWPPLWTLVAILVLVATRPWPVIWIFATAVVGLLTLRQLVLSTSRT